MFRYAQIDQDGYIISDSHLSGEIQSNNMVSIPDDLDITNKRYVNGEWEEYTPEPQPEPEMSDTEQSIFETQANTEYLVALAELS